jgi:drug/metabolite transporter, DME family
MSTTSDSRSHASRRTAFALLATSIAIGSFAFTLVKVALEELSPLGLATGRVVVSAVTFSVIVVRSRAYRQPILPADRTRVFLCGLGGSAGFHILFSWGQRHASVAVAAVVMATMPVMVAIGEVLFLRHRLRQSQVVGLVLATGGCAAIGLASRGGSSSLRRCRCDRGGNVGLGGGHGRDTFDHRSLRPVVAQHAGHAGGGGVDAGRGCPSPG